MPRPPLKCHILSLKTVVGPTINMEDERRVSKMEGKNSFSRHLKQFDGLARLTPTPPDFTTDLRCCLTLKHTRLPYVSQRRNRSVSKGVCTIKGYSKNLRAGSSSIGTGASDHFANKPSRHGLTYRIRSLLVKRYEHTYGEKLFPAFRLSKSLKIIGNDRGIDRLSMTSY